MGDWDFPSCPISLDFHCMGAQVWSLVRELVGMPNGTTKKK